MLIAEAAQRLTRRYAQLPADQISTATYYCCLVRLKIARDAPRWLGFAI
jgi:hypothetical protein